MWQPPERIKHKVPEERWPSAAEAAASRWFSPITVGKVTLCSRTWVPAMVPWRATEDGLVTDDVIDWYERFARGRPGALVVEATGVRDIPSGPLLRIGADRFVPGLSRLTEAVRRASGGETRLFIQIIDFLTIRRRPEKEKYLQRFLAITPRHRERLPGLSDDEIRAHLAKIPDEALDSILSERELESLRFGYRERVTDVDQPHIRDLPTILPEMFASAAARAEAAGFDGVELHYAHAYTMASFLSAKNDRQDGYGGPRENRIRLPLEVFHKTRAQVSPRFVVGCRYLSDEIIALGSGVDDAVYFGEKLAAAGVDFLSLSRGGKFDDAKQPKVGWAAYPYTGQSGYECMPTVISDARGPFGRNASPAAKIRASIRDAGLTTPVVLAGGVCSFSQAEGMLARGEADIVASARQSLCDPDWFQKIRLGRGEDIRRCLFTNYCEGLDEKHRQVTCQRWDRDDLDAPGVKRSSDGKRRLTAPPWEP